MNASSSQTLPNTVGFPRVPLVVKLYQYGLRMVLVGILSMENSLKLIELSYPEKKLVP
jgi:hypothetical protein